MSPIPIHYDSTCTSAMYFSFFDYTLLSSLLYSSFTRTFTHSRTLYVYFPLCVFFQFCVVFSFSLFSPLCPTPILQLILDDTSMPMIMKWAVIPTDKYQYKQREKESRSIHLLYTVLNVIYMRKNRISRSCFFVTQQSIKYRNISYCRPFSLPLYSSSSSWCTVRAASRGAGGRADT